MKNVLKVMLVIIGTLIGAGFASGKEVYIFFNKYGSYGIYGIILSGIIISIVIYKVLKKSINSEINNYNDLITKISNSKMVNKSLMNIINIFLLISFFVMVSGFASYFYQQLGINSVIMAAIMAILCFITFNKNIDGITKVNTMLIPFLIIFIIITAILNSKNFIENFYYLDVNIESFLIDNILDISMIQEKDLAKISGLTGFIFVALGICLYSLLTIGQSYVQFLDIPIIFIMSKFGSVYSNIYGVVVAIAIFTSAISAGYGFLENFEYSKAKYRRVSITICFISVFVSMIKFSYLVEVLYPIFGLLGFIQIILILKSKKVLKK